MDRIVLRVDSVLSEYEVRRYVIDLLPLSYQTIVSAYYRAYEEETMVLLELKIIDELPQDLEVAYIATKTEFLRIAKADDCEKIKITFTPRLDEIIDDFIYKSDSKLLWIIDNYSYDACNIIPTYIEAEVIARYPDIGNVVLVNSLDLITDKSQKSIIISKSSPDPKTISVKTVIVQMGPNKLAFIIRHSDLL